MDLQDATQVLTTWMSQFRLSSYAELKTLVSRDYIAITEQSGLKGAKYQLECLFFWESKMNENICVVGSIDDGEQLAFKPLTIGFSVKPNGEIIG